MAYLCLQAMRDGDASRAHVEGIVEGLRRCGWRVELIEPAYEGEPGVIRRIIGLASTQLRALGPMRRAELVYVRWHWAALPFVLVAKVCGRQVVVEVNGTDDDFLASWPLLAPVSALVIGAARWQLRLADALVAVTTGLGAWARRRSGGKRLAVVPNAADTSTFRPSMGGREGSEPYVIFVGALTIWQGVDEMVAASQHPEWPKDVKLVIVGDGAKRDLCAAAAGDRLRYLGRRPHGEIPALLAGAVASISVQTPMASRGQVGCSPIKLYEGLAVGRPLIVSRLPGVSEVVEAERCGVVVPASDPAALARAVALLAGDPALADQMGRRAREAAVAQHSWAARARTTASFLDQVLGP